MTFPVSSPHVECNQVSKTILLDVSVRAITVGLRAGVLTNACFKRDPSPAALRLGHHSSPPGDRNIQPSKT